MLKYGRNLQEAQLQAAENTGIDLGVIEDCWDAVNKALEGNAPDLSAAQGLPRTFDEISYAGTLLLAAIQKAQAAGWDVHGMDLSEAKNGNFELFIDIRFRLGQLGKSYANALCTATPESRMVIRINVHPPLGQEEESD